MKRHEIDTDPSSPQSRRGNTNPGLGTPPKHAITPPAAAVATNDSIDEILEGITNRPRSEPAPRRTAQTSGETSAAYQASPRAPQPALTDPIAQPAPVVLSPSVERAAMDEKVPSSMPRPVVREAPPPSGPAPRPRLASMPDRPRDVTTVLTPTSRFKRLVRRSVIIAVACALAIILVALVKTIRPGAVDTSATGAPAAPTGAAAAGRAPRGSDIPPVPPPEPAATAASGAPNAETTSAATSSVSNASSASNATGASTSGRAAHAGAANASIVNAARGAEHGGEHAKSGSPAPSASASARPHGAADVSPPAANAPKAPPPPAPGYEEFKKSFTP